MLVVDDSAVRFTDYGWLSFQPSSKLLGYYQSSAGADWIESLTSRSFGAGEKCLSLSESVEARARIISLPIKPIIFEHRNSHQLFTCKISVEGRAGKIPLCTLVINQSLRRRVCFEKELELLTFNFSFKRADRLTVFTHNDYYRGASQCV